MTRLSGVRPTWAGAVPEGPWRGLVQVRAHGDARAGDDRAAAAEPGDELVVETDEPLSGVAPGQAVVCYDGTRVVGSATIAATRPALVA